MCHSGDEINTIGASVLLVSTILATKILAMIFFFAETEVGLDILATSTNVQKPRVQQSACFGGPMEPHALFGQCMSLLSSGQNAL